MNRKLRRKYAHLMRTYHHTPSHECIITHEAHLERWQRLLDAKLPVWFTVNTPTQAAFAFVREDAAHKAAAIVADELFILRVTVEQSRQGTWFVVIKD